MAPPLTIGLTGAIASGKSTALGIFERLGAATISADGVVHELLDGEPLASRLLERWGREVSVDGRIDRAAVGSIVFSDESELKWLESQIHPLVGEKMRDWLEQIPESTAVAVAEVPLLFEGEMHSIFDTTVAVVAEAADRAERARLRGQVLTPERERLQLSQEEKAARADHVIANDGTPEDLERKIADLFDRLTAAR